MVDFLHFIFLSFSFCSKGWLVGWLVARFRSFGLTFFNSFFFPFHFVLKVGWLLACLMSQQHASASQGWICSDKCTCCSTEIEAADQTFYLTQSQYTDTGPTSPSTDPITPGVWVATGVPIFKSLV